jgi:hypothetical protein
MSAVQPVIETPVESPAPAAASAGTYGILSLVLGLVSIVTGFTFVVPIVAIVFGVMALRREPSSRSFAIWGIVLGSIMVGIPLLGGLIAIGFAVPAIILGLPFAAL